MVKSRECLMNNTKSQLALCAEIATANVAARAAHCATSSNLEFHRAVSRLVSRVTQYKATPRRTTWRVKYDNLASQ
eukprot:2095838-Pleurochrysis_carterae.AAC.1